jgi:hypothetical protein
MVSVAGIIDSKISWEFTRNDSRSFDYRVGPTPTSDARNQCVFLRGIELSVPEKVISKWVDKAMSLVKGLMPFGGKETPTADERSESGQLARGFPVPTDESDPGDLVQVIATSS